MKASQSLKYLLLGAFLGLAKLVCANTVLVGVPVITPLDGTNPWCPGGLVQISITVQNSTNNGEDGRILIALTAASVATTWTGVPNSINAQAWHYAYEGGPLGTPAAPLLGNNNNNYPNGGYHAFSTAGPIQATKIFTIQLPTTMPYGQPYYIHIATNAYYLGTGANPGQGSMMSPSFMFTSCTPSGGSSFVGKRVEGTANNGEIMLYWLDYDFINSTNNQIRDTIPACMTIVSAQPQPFGGTPANIAGQTVQWRVADATAASTPVAYREKGALWVLVSLAGCAGQVCNTGQFTSSFFGAAWQDTNQVCQAIGGVNVTLYKRQYDNSYTPITSANDGQNVNYVLNYTLSGSGLRCFDSFNSYGVGTYTATGMPGLTGGKWTKDPDSDGNDQWSIQSLSTGERYLQYVNNENNYRILRYDCPAARTNGEDICGNMMVEADVRIDGNAANGDTALVLRNNNKPGSFVGGGARGYMVILSVDSTNPGTDPQNLQLQRNNDNWGAWTNAQHWPLTAGYTNAANAPKQGVWYTIKALEQPAGTFRLKYWERGTPEPAWQVTYTDASMAADGLACGNAGTAAGTGIGDGWTWQPGIAGQNDLMSYDNFRVYGAASLSNAKIWDSIPLGVDYVSAAPPPNGLTPTNSNLPNDMIRWDFSGNNFGAVGGVLYEGSGSFTWTGVVDCSEAGQVDNTGNIGADLPATNQVSNTTILTIASCGTPTYTRTMTSTRTPTPTNTATPSQTPSSTPTATRSITPSMTPSFTQTVTSTYTATRTDTPTQTPTYSFTDTYTPTSTRSSTPTVTDTNTVGPTPTFTATRTASPTFSDTPTPTPTLTSTSTRSATPTVTDSSTQTPTITVTVPFTSTNTPTATPTYTATPSFSFTATKTATPSSTASATESVTFSFTPTLTDTPTSTFSATETVTYSSTATRTASPTPTPSATSTPSVTITWTFTVSPTITETPVPVPHHVVIGAYNSAGELVKLIFNGSAQFKPGDLALSDNTIPGGAGGVTISFPGYLYDPTLGQLTSVLWLADNNDGQLVDGGVYTIKAEISDQFGNITTLQKPVQVVSVVPLNEIVIYNSAGEIVARPLLPAPPSGRAYTNMTLKTDSFAPEYDPLTGLVTAGFRFELTDETGAVTPVDWDGRSALGVPVASGSYTAELIYSPQGAGGQMVVESHGFVVLQTKTMGALDGTLAGPNPALHGQPIKVYYPVSPGYTAQAKLFNLAGELIGQDQDSHARGLLILQTSGAAPGVYIIQVESLSGASVVNRRTIKVAIVR